MNPEKEFSSSMNAGVIPVTGRAGINGGWGTRCRCAKMSTHDPQLENEERASLLVVEPTVRAVETRAGRWSGAAGTESAYNPPAMTARLRIAVVAAIFIALAAHSFAHPVVKECPCVHAAADSLVRSDTFVLPLLAGRCEPVPEPVAEAPVLTIRASRAPPVV